jgi:GTP-binding protein YchF
VNPVTSHAVIETELQLKDHESVEKKFEKTERHARIDPKLKAELDVLQRCREHLELGKNIRDLGITKEERPAIADLFLLTEKPVLYVANVEEASMHRGNKFSDMMKGIAKKEKTEVIIMSNSIEAQIAEMEDAEDRKHFMEEYGMKEPALDRLIHSAYNLLGLYTFFTAGEQEVRAWTFHEGWKAPQAAGVIHTDFEKGFIKAEVISYDDYIQYGSEAACRDAGKLRIEGKDYVVKDADVMHFRFNV